MSAAGHVARARGRSHLGGAYPGPGVGLLTGILGQVNERFGLSETQIASLDPGAAERALLLAAGLGNGVIGRAISKQLIALVLKRVGKRLAVGSAAKFIPVAGTVLAAGLGFSAMKVAGNAHIEDCYRTARAPLGDTGDQSKRGPVLDLFDTPLLPGLSSSSELVSEAEQQSLIGAIDMTDLTPFRFQGWTGKRPTSSFSWHYNFDTSRAARADPIPEWLLPVRARIAGFAGLDPELLIQALLIRYDPGRRDRLAP